MAFTRKMLKGLGISEELQEVIVDAHLEVVNALKEERDNYKKDADKLAEVQKELDDEKAKHEGDSSLQSQYDQLKQEFESYKTGIEKKETEAAKKAAYKKLLLEAGVSEKRVDTVLKVSDLEKIQLDKEGKIKDAEELTKNAKTEWADFIVTSGTKGAETQTPPSGIGGAQAKTPSRAAQVAQKHYETLYGVKGESK